MDCVLSPLTHSLRGIPCLFSLPFCLFLSPIPGSRLLTQKLSPCLFVSPIFWYEFFEYLSQTDPGPPKHPTVTFKLYDTDRNGILDSSVSWGPCMLGICVHLSAPSCPYFSRVLRNRRGWGERLSPVGLNLKVSPKLLTPQRECWRHELGLPYKHTNTFIYLADVPENERCESGVEPRNTDFWKRIWMVIVRGI